MPKVKNVATGKPRKKTKPKLSPEERSQVAKDRWAKRRAQETTQSVDNTFSSVGPITATSAVTVRTYSEADSPAPSVFVSLEEPKVPEPPPIAEQDPAVEDIESAEIIYYRQNSDGSFTQIEGGVDVGQKITTPAAPPVPVAAPQLAPVATKKPKRAPQPKEFSSALKEAEKRLGKAINERAEAMAKLAFLQSEIPNLMGIIQALKGSGNYVPPADYGFQVGGQAYQVPAPQYPSPLDAIHNAQPSPPVSRAQGGVQFSPEMVGTLEGPEDDDEDRYLKGGGVATEGKWL